MYPITRRVALCPDQRDKTARDAAPRGGALRRADGEQELLSVGAADRNDEAAAGLELLVQGRRQPGRGRGDGDRAERGVLRVTERPVADVDDHSLVAGGGERRAGALGERRVPLDRVHLGGELGEHGGLVSEPVPTSSTRSLPRSASISQIRATMYGWEIVWPSPIGSAASSYARSRNGSGTKSSRGTRSIAASTRSSAMSRQRSWLSTIRCRSGSGGKRKRHPEPLEHGGRDAGDARRRLVDPDGEHRHLRVARGERAVAAAADVATASEVGELEPVRRRDEHVAGVRVVQSRPRARERVREWSSTAASPARGPSGPKRSSAPPRGRRPRRPRGTASRPPAGAVEPLGERAYGLDAERQPVDLARAVGGADRDVGALEPERRNSSSPA